MTVNRYCPNCHQVLITELKIDDKKLEAYLHEYCEKCGFDIAV